MNFPEQDLASVAAGMICFRVISRFASFPTFPLSSCLPSCLPACQQSMANIGISIGVVQNISSENRRKCIIAEEGEGGGLWWIWRRGWLLPVPADCGWVGIQQTSRSHNWSPGHGQHHPYHRICSIIFQSFIFLIPTLKFTVPCLNHWQMIIKTL